MIVCAKNLSSYYGKGKSRLRYLKNVSLTIGEGEIVEVFQKGYMYKDKVIRYAMVKVAN